jgi:hypothetical protein
VRRSDPDIFFTTVAYPIKGTPYYNEIASKVTRPAKQWRKSSDREFDVKGRPSREFYGYADQLLRDEVELARLSRRPTENENDAEILKKRIATARSNLYGATASLEGRNG